MSANNRKNTVGNITLSKFDALFGSPDEPEKQESAPTDGVQEIPLEELHEFQGHPFRVRPDEELAELVESIRQNGVLVPGMARKRAGGGYEIIAGHTRKRACEIAGLKTMPMFVKDADDDEACLMMVDSNIQRENIRISEKARAYKMKYDAMQNRGTKGNTLEQIGEAGGDHFKTVQRLVWLARLNDDLLAMVDEKKLGMGQGVCLSFLTEPEQELVCRMLGRYHIKLSLTQAKTIRQLSKDGKLTGEILERYLHSIERNGKTKRFTLDSSRLEDYFPKDATEQEMTEVIFRLLEEWKNGGKSADRERTAGA